MKHLFKVAALAVVLAGTGAFVTAPASAAVNFSVALGNAAFGYSDGYWDRDHHWHKWQSKAQAEYYRTHYAEHYYAMRHDHDRNDHDQGWRNERWWENNDNH